MYALAAWTNNEQHCSVFVFLMMARLRVAELHIQATFYTLTQFQFSVPLVDSVTTQKVFKITELLQAGFLIRVITKICGSWPSSNYIV